MPSDDESDAISMHRMKHNFPGAGHSGAGTTHNMDDNNLRPLSTHSWVRTPCAGQHDSHTVAIGRLQPCKYPHSMHTPTMHEFSPVRAGVSHSSHDSCDENTTR